MERVNITGPAFLTMAMHEQTLQVHFTAEHGVRSRSTEGDYQFNGTHVTSARKNIHPDRIFSYSLLATYLI